MYLDYLDKYKGMEPYLHIPAEDWTYIKTTFAMDEIKIPAIYTKPFRF